MFPLRLTRSPRDLRVPPFNPAHPHVHPGRLQARRHSQLGPMPSHSLAKDSPLPAAPYPPPPRTSPSTAAPATTTTTAWASPTARRCRPPQPTTWWSTTRRRGATACAAGRRGCRSTASSGSRTRRRGSSTRALRWSSRAGTGRWGRETWRRRHPRGTARHCSCDGCWWL